MPDNWKFLPHLDLDIFRGLFKKALQVKERIGRLGLKIF